MNIIDFYSYKGGAGRSVTAWNTLPFIAEELRSTKKNPLLLLDLDLDSAGITYLLEQENVFKQDGRMDTMGYFSEDDTRAVRKVTESYKNNAFFKHTVDISNNIDVEEGSVLFMGVNDSDINRDYTMEGIDLLSRLNQIIKLCKIYEFSGIVFDSASGNQEIAQLCLSASTRIVTCMKATTQFRSGTFRYFKALQENGIFKQDAKVIIFPVAIPKAETYSMGKISYKEDALNRIIDSAKLCKNINISYDFINENSFGILEIESFKWKEKNLYKEKKSNNKLDNDDDEAYSLYRRLAKTIAKD